MKKVLPILGLIALCFTSVFLLVSQSKFSPQVLSVQHREDEEDGVDKALQQDFDLTKDPSTNKVPVERLLEAKRIKDERLAQQYLKPNGAVTGINWLERGANNIGGRSRALLFDLNDAANNFIKVWTAGVGGGLWYANDITAPTPVWNKIDDLLDNLAITSLVQNPNNPQEMYFGTGEGWFNSDAINGLGIWKSTNGGVTWFRLVSTNAFKYVNDLLIDKNGNLFAALRGVYNSDSSGVQKSTDGGATWKRVLGYDPNNGYVSPGADLELATNGDVYASLGVINYQGSVWRSGYVSNTTLTGDAGT